MIKQFIQDLFYDEVNNLLIGAIDPDIIIDGVNYINYKPREALKAFQEAGIVKNNRIIIPKGTIIENIKDCKYGAEYKLNYNGKSIVVCLAFNCEDEKAEFIQ